MKLTRSHQNARTISSGEMYTVERRRTHGQKWSEGFHEQHVGMSGSEILAPLPGTHSQS